MRNSYRVFTVVLAALGWLGASTAQAQDAWGDVSVSLARIDYDLSGTGAAPGLAVRATRDVDANFSLEFGGLYARPAQQFGPSTLLVPEALLRYRWRVGRVSPYVGGGFGAALVKSAFHTDWDPTLSGAVGAAVRLTDRVGVSAEFRVRGHEWLPVGTTTELSAGLVWRVPSF